MGELRQAVRSFPLRQNPSLLQHFYQTRQLPHVGNGEFFEGDEVFGVEGGGHGGGRILYLGVIAKEKAPPPQR